MVMEFSRRTFISGVAAGLAASYATTAMAQRRGRGGAAGGGVSAPGAVAGGEDGSKLWMRYKALGADGAKYQAQVKRVVVDGDSLTLKIIRDELSNGITGMMGAPFPAGQSTLAGSVIAGTPASSPTIRDLKLD